MGIDRIVAILAGRDSIREVIAFPKAASGADPLTGAPAPVDAGAAARAGAAAASSGRPTRSRGTRPRGARLSLPGDGRARLRAPSDLAPGSRTTVPAGFTVTAGGGSCCDRIRFSVSVDGERVADAGFDAEGCGAATAAGSAAVTLVRGVGCSTPRGSAPPRSPPSSVDSARASYTPPNSPPTRSARALGAAVRATRASAAPAGGPRTLVAMSGGVDSAVAALCAPGAATPSR